MDELISRLVERVGLSETQARSALAIVLAFLEREAPPEALSRLMDALPGARELLGAPVADTPMPDDTRHFGGMARLMRVADRLMATGLDMGQVQGTVREVLDFSREAAGPATVEEVITAIPGLRHAV